MMLAVSRIFSKSPSVRASRRNQAHKEPSEASIRRRDGDMRKNPHRAGISGLAVASWRSTGVGLTSTIAHDHNECEGRLGDSHTRIGRPYAGAT